MIFYCNCLKDSTGFNDYAPVIISIIALFFAIYVVILSKKVEISINKFNKLCLEPMEKKFASCESIIEQNKNAAVRVHLNELTSNITDLNVLLTCVQRIYPKLNIDELQDISFVFTDKAFNNINSNMSTIQLDFLTMKITMLKKTYDYSIYQEVKFSKLF